MVGVLLLVDLWRTPASSMQSEDEGVALWWHLADAVELELHGLVPDGDGALLDEHAVELAQFQLLFLPGLCYLEVLKHQ